MNLAEWLVRAATLNPEAPALFHGARQVADYAGFAARAAAITCSRRGADLPRRSELR